MVHQCLDGEKNISKVKVEKKRCLLNIFNIFNGVLKVPKKIVSTVKETRFVHSGFTLGEKVFQRCSNGEKKNCFD